MNLKEVTICNVRCIIRYPNEYREGQRYPLLLFLHGAGTRGDDIQKLITHPFFELTQGHKDYPFVTIVPFCMENTWFDMWERLLQAVKKCAALPFVDSSRIYLMGASMGGYGAWQLAMSLPEYFAAMVPISGGGMAWNAKRLVNIPAWAFHKEKDPTVSLDESVKMVEAVNRAGGWAKLTVYPGEDHDAWSDTFSNIEVFSWLLEHENKNTSALVDEFVRTDIYG